MKTNWIYFLLTIYIAIYNVNAEFRYKIRGPPLPPRPPVPPMFIKKWHMNGRLPPIRAFYNRPIMALPAFPIYKGPPVPMIHRPKLQPPLVFPTTLWKTPTFVDTYKPPTPPKPQYIHVSPQTNIIPEYEFHISKPEPIEPVIQQPHTIKQIDEKGPIHTIPAPNLSLADKPIVVAEVQQNIVQTIPSQGYQLSTIHNDLNSQLTLGLHQYQVHEQSPTHDHSLIDPLTGHNKYYAPDPDPSLPAHRIPPAVDPFSQPSNGKPPPLDLYTGADHPTVDSQQQLASQEILQLLQGYPQQQLVDTYGLPIAQQPQLQQHILQQNQQPNLHQQQTQPNHNGGLFMPEPNYFTQQNLHIQPSQYAHISHQQQSGQNAGHDFRPEYQTFNYDEQTKQNSVPSTGFGYSESNYNLETAGSNRIHSTAVRNTQEDYTTGLALQNYIQPQNVEQFVSSNIVDTGYNQNVNVADPASVYAQMTQNSNNIQGGPLHYTTLPNRETAETLASLQAAGQSLSKQNSVDQESAANEKTEYTPMRIVVPDENENSDQALNDAEIQASNTNEIVQKYEQTDRNDSENTSDIKESNANYDYEDYGQESEDSIEDIDNLTEKENNDKLTFGARIQAKNKT